MKKSGRRYLRPYKLGKHSQKFFVFDTETGIHNRKNGDIEYILSARPEHMIFGCVYGPDGYRKVIHSVKEFKQEFKKRIYKNKIVYAHNAEYDLSAVYGNIYLLDKSAIFNGKFISCTNGNCRFADSFNLLPTSVKKLGELLGLPKEQLGNNLKSNVRRMHEDVRYCMRDCEIVYKSLEKLFAEAEPSYTIGSLSLKIFRANFLESGIKVNELSDMFFECLYGGRTEAFKIGDVNAHVYDLKSAYPAAMKVLRFPDPARLRMVKVNKWQDYLKAETGIYNDGDNRLCYIYEGMIDCTITVGEMHIPPLPFRTKDKLLFPIGTFRGCWTLNEFRYAYENFPITVHTVHKMVIAESIETPFEGFIDHYFNRRAKTKDIFEKYYYKLFMNNLYGKLIQRAKDEFRFCENFKEGTEFMRAKKLKRVEWIACQGGGFFLKYDIEKIFSHTIACWGAYITAHVRVLLHKGIMQHPYETVYCDTDSRMVEKNLRVPDSEQLGTWTKEKKIVTRIRALKDYVYIDETGKQSQMLKGVKKDAKQLDSEANVFKVKRMVKTRESFRRVDNLPPGTFIEQLKVLTGDYSKRIKLKDGTTKPFKLQL